MSGQDWRGVSHATWRDLAREVFPEADEAALGTLLWEYTGFPGFFDGDPATECRRQLIEARDALAAGQVFDLARGWHDPD